jgi:hypothetical protein
MIKLLDNASIFSIFIACFGLFLKNIYVVISRIAYL